MSPRRLTDRSANVGLVGQITIAPEGDALEESDLGPSTAGLLAPVEDEANGSGKDHDPDWLADQQERELLRAQIASGGTVTPDGEVLLQPSAETLATDRAPDPGSPEEAEVWADAVMGYPPPGSGETEVFEEIAALSEAGAWEDNIVVLEAKEEPQRAPPPEPVDDVRRPQRGVIQGMRTVFEVVCPDGHVRTDPYNLEAAAQVHVHHVSDPSAFADRRCRMDPSLPPIDPALPPCSGGEHFLRPAEIPWPPVEADPETAAPQLEPPPSDDSAAGVHAAMQEMDSVDALLVEIDRLRKQRRADVKKIKLETRLRERTERQRDRAEERAHRAEARVKDLEKGTALTPEERVLLDMIYDEVPDLEHRAEYYKVLLALIWSSRETLLAYLASQEQARLERGRGRTVSP